MDHIVLHTGTNDLRTKHASSQIAKATTDLSTSLKNVNTVTVSSIIPRLDELNKKGNEVNNCLVLMFKERKISFLSYLLILAST